MNYQEFKNELQSGKVRSLYLFTGEEEYVKQSMLRELRKRLLPEGMEDLNESLLENPDADMLMAACETVPFLAEKRLVIVSETTLFLPPKKEEEEDGESSSDGILGYLKQIAPTACLVFYRRGSIDGRTKLCRFCKAQNCVVEFNKLSEAECADWVQKTVRANGKTISPSAVSYLLFTVGKDISLLNQELHKLIDYVDEQVPEITEKDIDAICTPSTECTVFQMVDEQVAGHMQNALLLLNKLYKSGEDSMMVLAMLLRQYRSLYHMRCLMEERNQNQAALLGIPAFSVGRMRQQATHYTKEQLKAAYEDLLQYEYRIKQGKINYDGCAEIAMFRLNELLKQERSAK